MKKNKILSYVLVGAITLGNIFPSYANTLITDPTQEVTEITQNQLNKKIFDETMEMVSELESLAEEYVKRTGIANSPQEVVCIYIRCERYNSFSWSFFAGSKMPDFEAYVASVNPDLAKLKKMNELILPNGETTDFVHMIAAINMYQGGCGALGSWAGDAVQLASNIKNDTGTIDELTERAKFYFKNKISMFNDQDVIADLDATNIYYLYTGRHTRLSNIMKEYFEISNTEIRVSDFVNFKYQFENLTKETLRNVVYNDFAKTGWITSLESSNGVSGDEFLNHRKAAVYAFSDYLYENYPYDYTIQIKDLNKKNILRTTDEDFQLNYSINKAVNAKDKRNVVFYSNDEDVIQVIGDKFHILKEGIATLRVQSVSSSSIYSEINVIVKDRCFEFDEDSMSIDLNERLKEILIKKNDYDEYKLKSSDESILRIAGEYAIPISCGAVQIFAYDEEDRKIACLPVDVTDIEKEKEDISNAIIPEQKPEEVPSQEPTDKNVITTPSELPIEDVKKTQENVLVDEIVTPEPSLEPIETSEPTQEDKVTATEAPTVTISPSVTPLPTEETSSSVITLENDIIHSEDTKKIKKNTVTKAKKKNTSKNKTTNVKPTKKKSSKKKKIASSKTKKTNKVSTKNKSKKKKAKNVSKKSTKKKK